MSEDSTEGGKRITRRKALGVLAAGAVTTAGLISRPTISIGTPDHHTELPSLTPQITEINMNDKQKFLDQLRKLNLLESTVSDYQVAAFSIKSFAIHQPNEEDKIYPKFAILPPLDESNYLPRIIMKREGQPVPLDEKVTKFANGIKIITWSTPLADTTRPDIPSVSKTNSSETVLKYYNGVISPDGNAIIDRNLSQICYFPADYLVNAGIPQSMQIKDLPNKKGLPINLNKLPERAQDYLMNRVLHLK